MGLVSKSKVWRPCRGTSSRSDPSEDDASNSASESDYSTDNDVQLISANGQLYPSQRKHVVLRARSPEPIPVRFAARGVREQNPLLVVQSLLARAIEHPCGWKGCGAVLASEELLRRHVYFRNHPAGGRVNATVSLPRCNPSN